MASTAKVHPELALAAMRQHEEVLFRMWVLLRALDTRGVGWVDLGVLALAVERHALWHPESTRRTLRRGEGDWWRGAKGRVYLVGLADACERLGVSLHAHPVAVPLDRFRGIGTFRAALLSAYVAERPRTLSLATWCDLTGRSRRGVHGLLRRSGVKVTENGMASARTLPAGRVDPELVAQGYRLTRLPSGEWVLVKEMPRTYHAPHLDTLPYGAVKRLPSPPSAFSPGATARKRYYDGDVRAAAKGVQRLAEGGTVYVATERRTLGGVRLWQGVTRVNRRVVVC